MIEEPQSHVQTISQDCRRFNAALVAKWHDLNVVTMWCVTQDMNHHHHYHIVVHIGALTHMNTRMDEDIYEYGMEQKMYNMCLAYAICVEWQMKGSSPSHRFGQCFNYCYECISSFCVLGMCVCIMMMTIMVIRTNIALPFSMRRTSELNIEKQKNTFGIEHTIC